MVNRTSGNLGLHKAGFFLALFSFPLFAYTPPATPNLPLSFEFLGSNAEAESTAFYNTQCDSNNYSWYGTDWFCAVGDPSNPVCYVKMAYFSSDVNHCQTYVPPEQPTPFLEPDTFTEKGGSNQNLISKLELMRIQDFNKNYEDGQYQNTDLALSRQNNSLLSSLNRTLQYSNDNRSIVDAINNWGSSHMIETKDQHLQDTLYRNKQDAANKVMFEQEMGVLGFQLSSMRETLESIDNKTGTGGTGGGSDWPVDEFLTQIYRIGGSVGNVSSNTSDLKGFHGTIQGMNGMLSYIMPEQTNILKDINASIKSLGGTPSDNTAIVEQLVESNNSLSDITLRMRDIENAIGKSEKSIVDAIGKGGDGTDPDSVSSTGCASFQCSSDSPSCFIARKEWERSCALSQTETDGKGLVDSLVSSVKQYNESPDSDIQNIDAGVINTDALLNKYTNANGFNAGGQQTCPAPLPLDIGIAVLHLDLSPMCDLAAVISWFVIATAMLSSGLAIAKYS